MVGVHRVAPIASGIPTKTWACSTKREGSAPRSKRVAASVSGCSRYSDRIATNGEPCTTHSKRCPASSEPCTTRRERRLPSWVSHPDAWVAMPGSNDGMLYAKGGMLHPFLGMHCPFFPMHCLFLAMHCPFLPMHCPSLAMLHAFLAMLHAFAATPSEAEDAIHEESRARRPLHGVPDPSRGRGRECVGSDSERGTMRSARVGMPRVPAA